ncbi:MAG: hypothetical protein ABSG36_15210 [Acidimicrobiales bacterium]
MVLRYAIYVHEYFHPGYRLEFAEWHLFLLPDEPSEEPLFTICRNLTFDLHEFRTRTRIPLSQWRTNAGAEFLCRVCDELTADATDEMV